VDGDTTQYVLDLAASLPVVVFDTGSLVDEGKLASDGRDLRVVYWGDAGWEELPREIQGLDSITSTLWFPLQDTIEQGLSGDYYVYYGNPWPDSPTQAITQVFGTSSELVAHLNGETTGSEGETGTIGGSGFSWVAEESGYTPASITNTATLTYSHSGAIEPAQGTVALHVKPSWEPDDETTHYLFQAGQAGSDRLEIYKNSSSEMRFKVVAGGESYEVTEDAESVAGGWSSIVATWDDGGDSAYLYQNGEGTNSATITNTVSGTLDLWLGSQAGGGSSAEALMANLFVYDQALTQAQAESLHRSLLWADIMPQDEEWRGVTSTMTITYQYDPLYRLTGATYSGGPEYQYTYDAVGNRQIMDSPQGEVSYTYDAANRLTSVAGVTYTWDDNGNLTSDGVRSYTYDHANRLTQVTQGSQTTQFAYNGDGDRTSKTVDGDTTQYVLDLAATLPVVVSDTEAVYLYGLDIIAQQQAERQYYFHDGLGSVRQLLDSTGDLEANYAYDPFGVPVVTGDASNPHQFTGEAWDAEVELLYLRARYYQPETGRFITKDPSGGNAWQPTTLNRYVYVTNNPVNSVDPGGLEGGGPEGLGIDPDELPYDYGISGNPINDLIRDSGLWLRNLIETDPMVNHVYRALRIALETRYYQRDDFRAGERDKDPGRLSGVEFLCEAVTEARISMYRYAPTLCSSCSAHDCNKLTVRVALRALTAVVRWVGDVQWEKPRIPFETETALDEEGKVVDVRRGRNNIMKWALPEITSPYLDARLYLRKPPVDPRLGQTGEFDQLDPEDLYRYDKTYHYFTAALIAYELRWANVPASGAYSVTDWAGRAFEWAKDAPDNPYSRNDVLANRWGALFGITFFDDPDRLVRVCVGWRCYTPHHPGCI
jgi:RHS repeat-associated protein